MEEYHEFEIWMEGYAVTGNICDATYIGRSKGIDFKDACKNYRDIDTGDSLILDSHYDYPCIWGCQLFDNEVDARKSFG